jgi:hypothetical protein
MEQKGLLRALPLTPGKVQAQGGGGPNRSVSQVYSLGASLAPVTEEYHKINKQTDKVSYAEYRSTLRVG